MVLASDYRYVFMIHVFNLLNELGHFRKDYNIIGMNSFSISYKNVFT